MIPVESPHPPGMIGISAGELARYTAFTASFAGLCAPADTRLMIAAGYDTAYNSNDVIKGMLTAPDAAWVQIHDDDHTFPSDMLLKLLDRNVDVIVPLYTQRQPPFFPCIFKSENEDGSFNIFTWEDLEGLSGLLPICSAGKGGILIRRHVVETLKDPWFERQGKIGEDHLFFKKCREAGFGVYVDLDVRMGHLTPVEVAPFRNEHGQWCGRVDLKRGLGIECWPEAYDPARAVRGPERASALNAV